MLAAVTADPARQVLVLNRPQCPLETVDGGRRIAGGAGYLDLAAAMAAARPGPARPAAAVAAEAAPEWVEAGHPSYIIYTSGTTGRPKGVVRDTGG